MDKSNLIVFPGSRRKSKEYQLLEMVGNFCLLTEEKEINREFNHMRRQVFKYLKENKHG